MGSRIRLTRSFLVIRAKLAVIAYFNTLVICSLALLNPTQTKAAHEIAFLIDTSGSMIQTDPKNLRQPAVRLAAQLLPQGTNAGIWLFDGTTAQLKSFGKVDSAWKNDFTVVSHQIHSKGQWTNLETAIATVSQAFSPTADSKSLILLTDGHVDISRNQQLNQASRARLLNEVLNDVDAKGIQIHAIALSENTDQDLLQRLTIGSNGMYALAKTADDLMGIFLQAFDQSIAADQVPLTDNIFTVDSSIQEFTALIFRKPGSPVSQLQTPDGVILSPENPGSSQWFTDKLYDLVTVSAPKIGEWQLLAEIDPENRVTIVSDLELSLRGLPNNIIQGQSVTMAFFLEDEHGPIKTPSLLSLLDIDFEQTMFTEPVKVMRAKVTSHSQGTIRTPPDGIFTAKLSKTLVNGEHEFKVTVDGKTFQREQSKRARVFAQIFESSVAIDTSSPENTMFLSLIPIKGLVKPASLSITGSIKSPNGQIDTVAVNKTKFGTWTVQVPPIAGKAIYKAYILVEGETNTGDSFSLTQGPITVDYTKPIAAQTQPQDLFDTLSDEGDVAEQQEVKQALQQATQPSTTSKNAETQVRTPTELSKETAVATQSTGDEPETESIKTDEMSDQETVTVDETVEEQASHLSSILLYLGIGFANLLLCGGGFIFGRKWYRKKQAQAAAEDNALLNELNTAKTNAEQKKQAKSTQAAAATPEPPQDDTLNAEAAKISDMLDSIDNIDDIDDIDKTG